MVTAALECVYFGHVGCLMEEDRVEREEIRPLGTA